MWQDVRLYLDYIFEADWIGFFALPLEPFTPHSIEVSLYHYPHLVDSKKLASRFISSWRNLAISSSILRISESKRSRMLLNSVSMTLKSPSLMGIFLLLASAIFVRLVFGIGGYLVVAAAV